MHKRETMMGRAKHAASLMRDLFDVAREVAAWRRERDAFVAMHQLEEMRREAQRGRDLN